MKLDKIKEITSGAAYIEEKDERIAFHRFTKEQEELYKKTNEPYFYKAQTTAGIKLSFLTDSKRLFLRFLITSVGTRFYFSIDVLKDGEVLGYIDNFSGKTLERDYTRQEFPDGVFSKEFNLGEGEKKVEIYLPWSAKAELEEIRVDDGAFVKSARDKKTVLVYGDSITQGYDALRPSNRYMSRICRHFGFEEYNKAIGGEVFFEPLSRLKDSFSPDYIIIAYGTNDWSKRGRSESVKNMNGFYKNVSENYPDSKIFSLSPIWRKDMTEEREYGKFSDAEEDIKKAVSDLEKVTFISGFDFVPKDIKFYADLRLHPNDEGFLYYYKALAERIEKCI